MAHKTPGQTACGSAPACHVTLFHPEFCVAELGLGRPETRLVTRRASFSEQLRVPVLLVFAPLAQVRVRSDGEWRGRRAPTPGPPEAPCGATPGTSSHLKPGLDPSVIRKVADKPWPGSAMAREWPLEAITGALSAPVDTRSGRGVGVPSNRPSLTRLATRPSRNGWCSRSGPSIRLLYTR
jgi:hypothetical protein